VRLFLIPRQGAIRLPLKQGSLRTKASPAAVVQGGGGRLAFHYYYPVGALMPEGFWPAENWPGRLAGFLKWGKTHSGKRNWGTFLQGPDNEMRETFGCRGAVWGHELNFRRFDAEICPRESCQSMRGKKPLPQAITCLLQNPRSQPKRRDGPKCGGGSKLPKFDRITAKHNEPVRITGRQRGKGAHHGTGSSRKDRLYRRPSEWMKIRATQASALSASNVALARNQGATSNLWVAAEKVQALKSGTVFEDVTKRLTLMNGSAQIA